MALAKDKPKDIPSGNDLDKVDINPESGLSIDAYLSFGSTPKAVPNPPKVGEIITYLVKVEVVGDARRIRTDGEMRYSRALDIIGVKSWTPGDTTAPSGGDENQGALFDENGEAADGEDAGAAAAD